jgi:hypothetical protein
MRTKAEKECNQSSHISDSIAGRKQTYLPSH